MTDAPTQRDFALDPDDSERLANLCGPFDEHLRQIELRLGVEIANRGPVFRVIGDERAAAAAERALRTLYDAAAQEVLDGARVHLQLAESGVERATARSVDEAQEVVIRVKRGMIKGRGPTQARYLHAIARHDINFGVGPAGTGKTYLAVASAVEALAQNRVQRLILVRPAVEAGEKLGFLPGDLTQKIDPYLRPLYDALYDLLGFESTQRLFERGTIEIAPLAFMRGRTLNKAFIILDEAQNTTAEQMKMFLTRIGFGSRAVITGDLSQIDLPRGVPSGLAQAAQILRGVRGVALTEFTSADVVRHPLVARIVEAYERAQAGEAAAGSASSRPRRGRAAS